MAPISPAETVARRVAKEAYFQELKACQILRYSPVECYNRAAAVLDETYNLALDPMPRATLTRFRPMRKS
jgi:hypothetical protein